MLWHISAGESPAESCLDGKPATRQGPIQPCLLFPTEKPQHKPAEVAEQRGASLWPLRVAASGGGRSAAVVLCCCAWWRWSVRRARPRVCQGCTFRPDVPALQHSALPQAHSASSLSYSSAPHAFVLPLVLVSTLRRCLSPAPAHQNTPRGLAYGIRICPFGLGITLVNI